MPRLLLRGWMAWVVLAFAVPLRADSRLVFPRVLFKQGSYAGIAIANPTDKTASLTITAYQSDGTPYASPVKDRSIPAGSQMATLASQLFQEPSQTTRLWMEVTSTTNGLTGFFLDGDFVNYADGSDLGGAAINQTLPLVENSGGNTTEISVVNPDATPALVELEFFDAKGKAISGPKKTLPPRGALQGLLSDIATTDYSVVAGMRVRSDRPILCFGYISRKSDNSLVTVSGQNPASADKTLSFPQLAQGDGWLTTLGLLNMTTVDTVVTITAYKADGTLFSAPSIKTENPATRTIPAGGVLRVGMSELFGFPASPLQVGWLKAETNKPALYGYVEYGAGKDRALVSAQMEGLTKAIFSHQAMDAPWFTGLAVLNTASKAANVEVVSLTPDGKTLGKAQKVLKPGQRESLLLQEWISSARGNGGSIVLKSDVPVVATELFGTAPGGQIAVLANVPPQKVTTSYDPAAALPSIKVVPPLYVIETGKTTQFKLEKPASVTWQVSGSGDVGKIAADGTYSAPAKKPAQHAITISAVAGALSGGATIDVVERQELVGGLKQVTAVAYYENLKQFFVAEQQILSAPSGAAGAAAVPGSSISEQKATGEKIPFLDFPGETIGKILPFVDAKGGNYMLIAGTTTGQVYRVNLADAQKQKFIVISGLNKPNSMTLDPQNGNLLVAEADKITVIPRAKFDPVLSSPAFTIALRDRPLKSIAANAPQGIAMDKCSGNVYAATAQGDLLEYRGNKVRTVITGLTNPKEMLPVYLEGMPSCEDAFTLFICEEQAIAVVWPAYDFGLEFVSDNESPRDLEFFPPNSPFSRGEDSLGIANENSISGVGIGDLYEEDDPETSEDETYFDDRLPYQDTEGDTFESDASYNEGYDIPDIIAVEAIELDDEVILGITFSWSVEPSYEDAADSLFGYIDFDLTSAPGITSHVEEYYEFGYTGLGVDAYIDLGLGKLIQVASKKETPLNVAFLDDVVVIEIPKSVLDVSKALVAMVVGNYLEPTDIAPNDGALDLSTSVRLGPEIASFSGERPQRESSWTRLPRPPRRPRVRDAKAIQ